MRKMLIEVVGRSEHVPHGAAGIRWTIWPIARLGDFTLEAVTEHDVDAEQVGSLLKRHGLQVLGTPRFTPSLP